MGDSGLNAQEQRAALARFISERSGGAAVDVDVIERLSGGSVQTNIRLETRIDGRPQTMVVRTSSTSDIPASRSRREEFGLLQAAFISQVPVPEPLWWCDDAAIFGQPFFVMRFVRGIAAAHRVVRDTAIGGERATLAERTGGVLARIHAIPLDRPEIAFVRPPRRSPIEDFAETAHAYLDTLEEAYPAIEWGIRRLLEDAPAPGRTVLAHRDFRIGNILYDGRGVAAVIDWEFSGASDPYEDIGWFCARCWRFGHNDLEAGGIGSRESFYRGYEAQSGRPVDDARVRFWETAAHVRWAIIAIQQAQRHRSGREPSLELALTGAIVPELQREILRSTVMRGPHV